MAIADPSAKASGRWRYTFSVREGSRTSPALALLIRALGWPEVTMTLGVAEFAALKEGLAESGLELHGVARRPAEEEREGAAP
jgi:hypothetical protein